MAKLVAIGDSLTQGFQSLAITHTDLSFPAMIAERMGLDLDTFRLPDFRGAGGLPCSIEWLARRLEDVYGPDISTFEWIRALHRIPALLDEVEDHWERGKGSRPSKNVDYHNLAVWGFEVGDALDISAALAREKYVHTKDGFLATPSSPRERTAYRVLNPEHKTDRNDDTQVGIAKRIREQEGRIDHLIVWLGANNCLRTVIDLELVETSSSSPGPFSSFTLWSKSAFESDYSRLANAIAGVGARHVYVATVPHVTIPPITRGIMKHRGRDRTGDRR
jgi:hypothetical protein